MTQSSGASGTSVAIVIEGCTVGEGKVNDLTINQETIDLTNRDSSRLRQIISATRSWSMTGTMNYVSTDVGKKVLTSHWENRSPATLTTVLTLADGTITATGETILTSLTFSGPHDGAAEVSFTLEGTDTLTFSVS